MKYLLILLFASFQSTHAQTVTFKEIKLKPKSEFYTTNESTIIYPLAFTNNKPVDKLINDKIKNEMLGEDAVTARKALTEQSSEGLVNMSYKVSFKKYGILSITIYAEGCGAHCSSWNTYFNFDLKTGKTISIYDLVAENRIDSFRKIVSADKIKALNKYKEEKRNYSGNDIDSASIHWAIEQVDDNCIGNIQLEHFSLSETGIEIMDPCEFPHAIRALEPDYALKYSYKDMLPFLKPAFQHLFSK
jgi:hypothetical protein